METTLHTDGPTASGVSAAFSSPPHNMLESAVIQLPITRPNRRQRFRFEPANGELPCSWEHFHIHCLRWASTKLIHELRRASQGRRSLILVPRETPLSSIDSRKHDKAQSGRAPQYWPPMPGFYQTHRFHRRSGRFHRARICDQPANRSPTVKPWGSTKPPQRRGRAGVARFKKRHSNRRRRLAPSAHGDDMRQIFRWLVVGLFVLAGCLAGTDCCHAQSARYELGRRLRSLNLHGRRVHRNSDRSVRLRWNRRLSDFWVELAEAGVH